MFNIVFTIHTGAVYRYYESRQWLFLDSQLEQAERAKRTRLKSKNKALRKQVKGFVNLYVGKGLPGPRLMIEEKRL